MGYKILLTIILVLFASFLFGCGPKQINPPSILKPELKETSLPNDKVIKKIKELEEKIGKKTPPITITFDGKKYAGFTRKQLQQLTASNKLSDYMKEIIKLQHEQEKLRVYEINKLKSIIDLQHLETTTFRNLYTDARNDANEERYYRNLEGYGYKGIIVLQLILMLLLI